MQRHKRGDIRSDGLVFWQYGAHYPNGEFWTTPEKFAAKVEKQKNRKASTYKKDKRAILDRNKEWRTNNPEKFKKSSKASWEKRREQNTRYRKDYYKKNCEELKRRALNYTKKRRAEDPLFALTLVYRNRLSAVFKSKGWKRPCPRAEMVGCSWEELKKHIERQFLPGMSWENRGVHGWHVDHIVPLSFAKTPDELLKLCHYTNLQPLWAFANLSKGKKHKNV